MNEAKIRICDERIIITSPDKRMELFITYHSGDLAFIVEQRKNIEFKFKGENYG